MEINKALNILEIEEIIKALKKGKLLNQAAIKAFEKEGGDLAQLVYNILCIQSSTARH